MKSNRRNDCGTGAAGSIGGLARRSCLALTVLAMMCGFSGRLHAKVDAGISGIVADSSGAVVSGASVEVKDVETGIVQKRLTNADGFYAFVDLQPGHYDVEVSQTGFNTFRQTGVLLDVNSAKVLNIKLNVGQVSEKVEVTSATVQLDTASTQNGEVIRAETITSVPLVTRSYTDLLALQPGVTPISSGLAGGQGGAIQRHRIHLYQHFRRSECWQFVGQRPA